MLLSRRSASVLRRDEGRLIGWVLVAILALLVVAPTVELFLSAVKVQSVDAFRIGERSGALTSYYLWEAFVSPISRIYFWQPFEHTMVTSVGAVVVAVVLGGLLAWCTGRFEFPGRRLLGRALLLPWLMPSWAIAQSWLTTFHNVTFGGTPGIMQGLGWDPPRWLAAGAIPIILVLGVHLTVFVYLLASGGIRAIGGELEEAARVLGGRRGQILRRITAPLLIPSLSSAGVLVFAAVLGDFSPVYLLGLPVHYDTLATSLYANLQIGNNGVVAVLAATVVVLGAGAIVIEGRVSRRTTRFAMLRQGSPVVPVRTEHWWSRYLATGFVASVVGIGAGLPLFILTATTFTIVPGRFARSNLTLRYWLSPHLPTPAYQQFPHGILRGSELYTALWNSVRIMGGAAVLCGMLGLVVGFVVTRAGGRVTGPLVRQLSFLPYLIPGISLAAAYILLFDVRRGPIPDLYGSFVLLTIAMIILHLPYASRSAIASFTQMGRAPEEAARIQGASFARTMRRIVFPMQVRAFVTGVTLAFVSGLRELNVVIMLTLTSTGLLASLYFDLQGSGYNQLADGVALVTIALSLGGYLLLRRLFNIDLNTSLGGTRATDHAH